MAGGETRTERSSADWEAGVGAAVGAALQWRAPAALLSSLICLCALKPEPLLSPALPQGPVHTALAVAREEGAVALWSGATATTIRQGSNQMSLFWGKAVADTALWGKHVSRGAGQEGAGMCRRRESQQQQQQQQRTMLMQMQ